VYRFDFRPTEQSEGEFQIDRSAIEGAFCFGGEGEDTLRRCFFDCSEQLQKNNSARDSTVHKGYRAFVTASPNPTERSDCASQLNNCTTEGTRVK